MKNIPMQATPISEKEEKDNTLWYVMTSPDPKRVEERLLEENISRERGGEAPFQYFIPYSFLKRRIADVRPEDDAEETEGKYFNPKSRSEVSSNNELRSALKRYIFIKASCVAMERLLTGEENRDFYQRLWYYRDKSRNKVTVSHVMMEQFINACCDKQINFEVWPALDSIEENLEVILNTTQFKGYKARVLEVRRDKNGICLTVGFHLFHGAMLLKLPNVRPQDVLYEPRDTESIVRETNRYKFVEDIQRKLFKVLDHRLKGNSSEKEIRKDASTLELLYNYRYRFFESDSMRRKFGGLMLLCAYLRGDTVGKSELAAKVRRELAAINARPEGKTCTDTRCFLESALYLSTGEQGYKDSAMAYLSTRSNPSATHQQLMKYLAGL